ncbi:YbjQ family protein [Parabacteroides pacaensis]|uniref:YbjQ family protein n=1 Tax=Parabacteroides pacaensis TaxID=2086575 RepID=UPI000D100077|nr:YbjQ family protein [Parabacteroides pacaensis]
MSDHFLISTTNTIENAEIEHYLDLVSTNIVIGTNFFADFSASFTDIFGGYANTYQSKLQNIYQTAITQLRQSALLLGANAIVGLKIDFDEISGKGKSMFMVSAVGMAVILNSKQETKIVSKENVMKIIPSPILHKEYLKRVIVNTIEAGRLPNEEQWTYLLNNPINNIADSILKKYLANYYRDKSLLGIAENLLLQNTISYFRIIDYNTAITCLYSQLTKHFVPIFEILEKDKLFSSDAIISLIERENIQIAIACLLLDKDYYNKEDLNKMNQIITLLDSLPDKGKIQPVKNLIGKTKDKYICPSGHNNEIENEYCEILNCGLNIKGLTVKDIKQIDLFKLKVESLNYLLSKN